MGGGGGRWGVLSTRDSSSPRSQAKLWEVNVGHWGSYVSVDLQLSDGVHSQVRGAEATSPQPEKREILSLASAVGFNLITLSSRLHPHRRCACVICRLSCQHP